PTTTNTATNHSIAQRRANNNSNSNSGGKRAGRIGRASQLLGSGGAPSAAEASTEDYMAAAVYLKVIVPEHNCYKILSLEGSMYIHECCTRIASRLTAPLKRPLKEYGLYVAHDDGRESA